MRRAFLPLMLLAGAAGASAIVAFGNRAALANLPHGLAAITLARRWEWPLVSLAILLCLVLLALVIAAAARAWWLVGLAPILALFIYRFGPSSHRLQILENPNFVSANAESNPPADESIVGFTFGDNAYALPCRALAVTPVVLITDYDKRMILLWSAAANRAIASTIFREFKPRNLDIISSPKGSPLIYDARLGQFIVAVTGQTIDHKMPIGFDRPIATFKTSLPDWCKQHPATLILKNGAGATAPVPPVESRVAIVDVDPPVAMRADVNFNSPRNFSAGKNSLVVFRDSGSGRLRAFDRNVKEDLYVRLESRTNRRHREAVFADPDTNSSWTIDGVAIDGPLKGSKLKELKIEPDLNFEILKFWMPQLQEISSSSGGG